jgi:Anti-sigma-K factor rskA
MALGSAVYRSGVERRRGIAKRTPEPTQVSPVSLEEQLSDAGHERTQLLLRLAEQDRTIADLRRKFEEQQKAVSALMSANGGTRAPRGAGNSLDSAAREHQELAIAQVDLSRLRKTIDTLTTERDEAASRAGTLDAKVGELTQLVRDRERDLDRKQEEVAKQQELLDRDRDIRELMGARDLYIAEVHDVDGKGETSKTYSRIFYTRGKKLIFYAYDLDRQPGLQNAGTFQVWGRRGPDTQKARSLGVLYEDNMDKKRWVLKATDPKTLEDIDAVFVTTEPNGGSQHPSGKQLLFASLRVSPNHP